MIFFVFFKGFLVLTLASKTWWQAPHRWPLSGSYIVFAGTQTKTQLHLDTLTKTDDLHFISLGPSMGKTFSYLGSKA